MKGPLLAVALAALAVLAGPAEAQRGRMGRLDVTPGVTPPVVQLYTFGRGTLIFEKFGHTALCLDYNEPRETACFNYGVTDFTLPPLTLTWRFITGEQVFFVEAIPLRGMLGFYQHEDRTIWRQSLPLAPEQARAVEARLIEDLDPKKGSYVYDHFVDNCTTVLRDIIDDHSDAALRKVAAGRTYPQTLRQMGRRGLAELPALIASADFALGRYLDHRPSVWEAMYHPFVLRDEVERAFGVTPELIYQRKGPPIPDDGPTGRPWALLIGLLVVLPLVLATWRGRYRRAAIGIAAVPVGLMGLVLWTVAIVSSIPTLRWNEALLLYVPTDLAVPFLSDRRQRLYARVRLGMIVTVSLLRAVGLFRQPLWIPIVIAFAVFALIAIDWRRDAR